MSRVIAAAWLAAAGPPVFAQAPALAGIAHAAFRVSDLPKAREFYGKLGFEEAFAFADPGKPSVSYIKVNDQQFIELYERAEEKQATGLMHVCYEARDIQVVWNAYVQRGVQASEPRKARAGNLLFAIHDPENQLIEYTQYLAGSWHSEDRGKHLGEHFVGRHLRSVSVPVRDPASEQSFYVQRLGFDIGGARDAPKLQLPGKSGDTVELQPMNSSRPRIVFTVENPTNAAEELRRRGLGVKVDADSVAVSDPDGVLILFVEEHRENRRTRR